MAVIAWDGGPSGTGTDWSVAANWSGDVLPGAADDVIIDVPGSVTITHTSGADSINSLSLASNDTLSLSGGSLSIATASTLDGTLALSGGTLDRRGRRDSQRRIELERRHDGGPGAHDH